MSMRPEHAFIAFILLLMLSGCAQQNEQMTEEKAVGFVTQHMQVQYPGAKTNVLEVKLQDGSWRISSEVIYGANTPCPNLSIVVYEYPAFGFVPRAENNITNNCQLLSCKGIENCTLGTTEEAIIASHKLNDVPEINSLIYEAGCSSVVGCNNVTVDAAYYSSYFDSITNITYPSVWVVNWTSPKVNYSLNLVLNQTGGKVLDKFKLNKQ